MFCDSKAEETNVKYVEKEKQALTQLQIQAGSYGSIPPTKLSPEEKNELFKKVVGGEKKGQIYGVGSAAPKFFTLKSSSAADASTKRVIELEDELKHVQEEHAINLARVIVHEKEEREQAMK